jgi:putative FmdB family regulatory protein
MPIYEYKCNKCGVFEAMQGIREAPLRKCPTCKGKIERLISRGSFILKGSGWYATDYAKTKPSSTESDSAPSASTNGTANDSSSKPVESKATESTPSSSESKASKPKSSSEKSVAAKAAD